MARWTASAEWAEGPALAGRRGLPLALRLSEGLGVIDLQYARRPSTVIATHGLGGLIPQAL